MCYTVYTVSITLYTHTCKYDIYELNNNRFICSGNVLSVFNIFTSKMYGNFLTDENYRHEIVLHEQSRGFMPNNRSVEMKTEI